MEIISGWAWKGDPDKGCWNVGKPSKILWLEDNAGEKWTVVTLREQNILVNGYINSDKMQGISERIHYTRKINYWISNEF